MGAIGGATDRRTSGSMPDNATWMAWATTPWAMAMAPAVAPTRRAITTSQSSLERIWLLSQARPRPAAQRRPCGGLT